MNPVNGFLGGKAASSGSQFRIQAPWSLSTFYLDDRFRLPTDTAVKIEHFLMFDDRCRLKPVIRERPRAERKLATGNDQ